MPPPNVRVTRRAELTALMARLFWFVAHGFNVVTIRTENEGAIVIGLPLLIDCQEIVCQLGMTGGFMVAHWPLSGASIRICLLSMAEFA